MDITKNVKTLITLLFLSLIELANAQSIYTGPIIVNRELGGDAVLPRSDVLSHTLVAYVQNGQVITTVSWGTAANQMDWTKDWAQDRTAAQAAVATGHSTPLPKELHLVIF